MIRIRWHRLFTRENLSRSSKWASVALVLGVGSFYLLVLESHFAFSAIYFWRQKQHLISAVFVALFVAMPAWRIYLMLHYVP